MRPKKLRFPGSARGSVPGAIAVLLGLASPALADVAGSIADLKELEARVTAAAAKVMPAMVFIDGGSGVIVSPDG